MIKNKIVQFALLIICIAVCTNPLILFGDAQDSSNNDSEVGDMKPDLQMSIPTPTSYATQTPQITKSPQNPDPISVSSTAPSSLSPSQMPPTETSNPFSGTVATVLMIIIVGAAMIIVISFIKNLQADFEK